MALNPAYQDIDLSALPRMTDVQRRVKELRRRALLAQQQQQQQVQGPASSSAEPRLQLRSSADSQNAGLAAAAVAPPHQVVVGQTTPAPNSFHARLMGLTAKITEAEAERRSAQLRGSNAAAANSASPLPAASGGLPDKRKRAEGANGNTRPGAVAGGGAQAASTPSGPQATEAYARLMAGQPQQQSSTAANSSLPQPKRTMFGAAPLLTGIAAARTQINLVDITSNPEELFARLRRELNDESRIQAPTIAVAALFDGGQSSFSISSTKNGKAHFGHMQRVAEQVDSILFFWDGATYVAHGEEALTAFCHLLEALAGVEVITFSAPTLLIPPVAHTRGAVKSRCINDIRTMAWMFTPHENCASLDAVFASYLPQVRFASPDSTLEGVVERLGNLIPLYRKLYGLLGSAMLLQAFMRIEKHLAIIVARMKVWGILVDVNVLMEQQRVAEQEMAELRSKAIDFCPEGPLKTQFNIQSTDDCRLLLFNHLGLDKHLPPDAVTKTGKISTSEETLKLLAPHHPLPEIIISYRKLAKLSQTYVDGVLEHATDDVGIEGLKSIHANFLLESTDTGRLSCTEPNMQNLPRGSSDAMGDVRKAFVAPPGCVLIAMDYEQIELCVLAHYCEDPVMIETLRSTDRASNDIHKAVAALVYKTPIASVTPEQRLTAKRVVFGVLYGIGAKALAIQINQSQERASHIQQQFNAAFPQVERLKASILAGARRDGHVRTFTGRWRPVPDIANPNLAVRSNAERQAFNTVIQGTAADIVKRAMIEVSLILPRFTGASLVGQVHDELIFVVPEGQELALIPELRQAMVSTTTLNVPLRVKVSCGKSLGTLKDIQ